MTELEQWQAYYDYAKALKSAMGTTAPAGNIKGRFLAVLVNKVVKFWEKHKATIVPFLTNLAIAALEALAAQATAIGTIDPPGPN